MGFFVFGCEVFGVAEQFDMGEFVGGGELVNVRELARDYSEEAILCLVGWMRGDDARSSMAAANMLLERAWGKAGGQVVDAPKDEEQVKFTIAIGDGAIGDGSLGG